MAGAAVARGLRAAPRAPGALRAELATPADEPALRRLLRDNPMGGAVRLTLEREPDAHIAAAAEGEPHATAVLRRGDGAIVAMGSRAVMDVFVNGAPRRVGYLSQLRVAPRQRGRLRALAAGYALLRAQRAADEEPYELTSILADNAGARRLLEAGLPGLPAYRALGSFVSLVIPTGRARRPRPPRGLRLEPGSPARLEAIAACLERNHRRFQLARRWAPDVLRSPRRSPGLAPHDFHVALDGEAVVGCLALWDQRAFKQVVVRGYGGALLRFRRFVNLAAPLLGLPRLPDPGQALSQAYLSHVAVDGDAPAVFTALLDEALAGARARGIALVVAGFAAGHPLLHVARRRRRARAYESVLYAVHDDGGAEAVAALDGRALHVEVALL